MVCAQRRTNGRDGNTGRLTAGVHVRNDFIAYVLIEHALTPAAMEGVRLLVEKRLVIVRANAEDLHPPVIDEITDRPDQAVSLKLPFIAMAGRECEQGRAPVAENSHAHVVPELW